MNLFKKKKKIVLVDRENKNRKLGAGFIFLT